MQRTTKKDTTEKLASPQPPDEPSARRLAVIDRAYQTLQDRLNTLGLEVEVWSDEPISERLISERDAPWDDAVRLRIMGVVQIGYWSVAGSGMLLTRTNVVAKVRRRRGRWAEIRTENGVRRPLLNAPAHVRVDASRGISTLLETIWKDVEERGEMAEAAEIVVGLEAANNEK